eukprot:9498620-Pyramimonas_sp.AAC.1
MYWCTSTLRTHIEPRLVEKSSVVLVSRDAVVCPTLQLEVFSGLTYPPLSTPHMSHTCVCLVCGAGDHKLVDVSAAAACALRNFAE